MVLNIELNDPINDFDKSGAYDFNAFEKR